MEEFNSIRKMQFDRFRELSDKKNKSREEKEEYEALLWYLSVTSFPVKTKPIIVATA